MSQKFKKIGLTIGLGISLAISSSVHANTQTFLFNNQLEFIGLDSQHGYELRIRLPQGELKSLFINPTESISFEAADFAIKSFEDGMYKYELLPLRTSHKSRIENSNKVEPLPIAEIYSGVFTVINGTILIDQDEPTRDQVIADDLIVQGSACIGLDCVNGESFGFDTLRLKENNLRIKFMDTSASASFPTTDWELTANDSTNGGANRFSITDIDAGRAIFTVEGGAPANSLYVENDGDVGFGTTNPVVKAHLSDGDSPAVRLEQNGTSGWTPQTWDLAGNETNFFIRDVTNGSKLPFRIQPGAPNDALFIKTNSIESKIDTFKVYDADTTNKLVVTSSGRIGFGTDAPTHSLHISRNENIALVLENSDTNAAWKMSNKGGSLQFAKVGTVNGIFEYFDDASLQIGPFTNRTLDLDSSGNLTIGGALTQNSDVHSKENIHLVDTTQILNKVMELPISIWNYKFDDDNIKHLGPMAQDFFKSFSLGAREDRITSIDTTGVALAAIKELGQNSLKTNASVTSLKQENQALKSRIEKLEHMIENMGKTAK